MNVQDAEDYTSSLGYILGGSWQQIHLGNKLGVPKALGLTLREWVEDRLGGYVRLAIPDRREAATELAAEGLSTREVADVLGIDHSTVARDVAHATEPPDDKPRTVAHATAPKCKHCPIHGCP